jgi:hypothetical protein
MSRSAVILLRTDNGPLSMQRVIRIANDYVFALMMGSMQVLRLVGPSKC